jgi:hypothetical protein
MTQRYGARQCAWPSNAPADDKTFRKAIHRVFIINCIVFRDQPNDSRGLTVGVAQSGLRGIAIPSVDRA